MPLCPPAQPVSGSVATTVAVRGVSRSNAISPTTSGGASSRTVGTPSLPMCVISAFPDPISKNDSARSPWRIKIRPAGAFSGRSCAASVTVASARQPLKISRAASSSALTAVSPATSRGYRLKPRAPRSWWLRTAPSTPRCPSVSSVRFRQPRAHPAADEHRILRSDGSGEVRQPGGLVDGIADHGVLVAVLGADVSCEHRASRDADPEVDVGQPAQLLAEGARRRQRRRGCALGRNGAPNTANAASP